MSLADDFKTFDRENPVVYGVLTDLATQWVGRRPGEVCGIGMLYEVARWTINLKTTGDPFKLNNNYRAYYARKMMADYPNVFDGLFRTRKQKVAP